MTHRVVIVGGGFAGVACAKALGEVACDVVLVDRRNFHLFQPLLYQVATGGLSPGDIAAPLRSIVKAYANVRVIEAEVTDIDVARHAVRAGDADLPYDTLVLCAGVRHSYFGHEEWEPHAPGLKSIEDATEIRARVLEAFERAEIEEDAAQRAAWLTFVVVVGGPTGVELAGALGELAHHAMKGEFRSIRSSDAQVILLEGSGRILGMYEDRLSAHATRALAELGVQVRTGAKVVGVDAGGVAFEVAATTARIAARTVLWAAGVQASPLSKVLEQQTSAKLDRAGRVIVEPDLSIASHPEILVLGDLTSFTPKGASAQLPGTCPVAMQMGRHAAGVVEARIAATPSRPFVYFDKGAMAVIGRSEAVARLGVVNWGLTGFVAWCAWLFIHLLFLVGYENRLLVLIQWANHYLTRNRGARLITRSAGAPGPARSATSTARSSRP